MQRFIFLGTVFLSFLIVSCKSQEKAVDNGSQVVDNGPQPTKEPNVYKGVVDSACEVEVSFGSYGSGVDGPSYEKVIKLIEDTKLKYTEKGIGREGESRMCLPLTEIKGKQKTEFIEQLKKIAKEGQLVSVSIR